MTADLSNRRKQDLLQVEVLSNKLRNKSDGAPGPSSAAMGRAKNTLNGIRPRLTLRRLANVLWAVGHMKKLANGEKGQEDTRKGLVTSWAEQSRRRDRLDMKKQELRFPREKPAPVLAAVDLDSDGCASSVAPLRFDVESSDQGYLPGFRDEVVEGTEAFTVDSL